MKNETITTPLTDRQLIDEGRGYAHTINAAFCRKIELRMHAAEAKLAAERAFWFAVDKPSRIADMDRIEKNL